MPRRFLLLALLLFLGACALVYEAAHLGLTADEPSHLAASYAWWLGSDTLLPSDTPPLTRIISGWIPRAMQMPWRPDTDPWRSRNAYEIGPAILSSLDPARAQRLIFCMRLPFIAFPLLIALLIWRWGSELFGERIGLILATCGILEPTILGHGALIKSDVPAAFCALWFAYVAYRYWQRPCLRRLLIMTLAMLIAALTKFTLLPLFAVALALALWRGPRLAGATFIPLTFYVGTLAAYQFQAAPLSRADIHLCRYVGVPGLLMPVVRVLAVLPWPHQLVRGLLFITASLRVSEFPGYMLGHRIAGMAPAYYPLAWAIKFPIPLQILTVAGLAALACTIRQRSTVAAEVFVWGSAASYFVFAVFSNFHIGFRHLLPMLPFCILGGGFALARWGARPRVRVASVAGMAWLAATSLHVYPQGISYFNEWIGGSTQGWRYLADSNVDWGQNLPELATFVEQRRIPLVKTFLFGLDGPGRYLPLGSWDPQRWPGDGGVLDERRLQPKPGFYAVSVNCLTGLTAPAGYENYLAYFRGREPIGRAGYSIFIYEVK